MNDPDGVALMIVLGLIGLAFLLGVLFIERLLPPRHERHFPHLTTADRVRRAARQ
jgi:hypothetical protein